MSASLNGTVAPGRRHPHDEHRRGVLRWWRSATWAPTSLTPCDELEAGEVGYLTASIKTVRDTRVGDTVTLAATAPRRSRCPAIRKRSRRWCSAASTPPTARDYPDLRDALEKLQLNDASPDL